MSGLACLLPVCLRGCLGWVAGPAGPGFVWVTWAVGCLLGLSLPGLAGVRLGWANLHCLGSVCQGCLLQLPGLGLGSQPGSHWAVRHCPSAPSATGLGHLPVCSNWAWAVTMSGFRCPLGLSACLAWAHLRLLATVCQLGHNHPSVTPAGLGSAWVNAIVCLLAGFNSSCLGPLSVQGCHFLLSALSVCWVVCHGCCLSASVSTPVCCLLICLRSVCFPGLCLFVLFAFGAHISFAHFSIYRHLHLSIICLFVYLYIVFLCLFIVRHWAGLGYNCLGSSGLLSVHNLLGCWAVSVWAVGFVARLGCLPGLPGSPGCCLLVGLLAVWVTPGLPACLQGLLRLLHHCLPVHQ